MKSHSCLNILIVDDDALIRISLQQVLSMSGYNPRSSEGGLAALREIERHAPDVLLSDLNMPGMSGFELLSLVRDRFPAIKVIAMSSAYLGDDIPPGVFADAFYAKGQGGRSLTQILGDLAARTPSRNTKNHRPPSTAPNANRTSRSQRPTASPL